MLARLFVIFGGLFVLALCAALVGPYFVDWSSYKADFEREASAVLGRKVTVEGDVTARLLPFPSVTFSDVSVDGAAGGKPVMTVETFSMDAELAPFLRGEFLIFDMRLVRPKVLVDVAADGTVDWAMRPSTRFDAKQISIEKLTITEGQVMLQHAIGDRSHALTEINAVVSAKSLAGPWRIDGSLRVDGARTRIAASTGTVDDAGMMRLRVRAAPSQYAFAIETDGSVSMSKGKALYAGGFKIFGDDGEAGALRGTEGEKIKVDVAKAKSDPGSRLNGKFSLDHARLGIEAFRFETGPRDNPYTADGKAEVDLGAEPHFSITASGAQVRFDDAVGGEGAAAGLDLSQRLAAFEQALVDMPRPTIPGTIEVDLPAIVAGDTTIRDVRLSSEPAEGGWRLKSVAATLPGRTRLEADGFLRTDGVFGFDGQLLLAVAQPSGFAAWVSKDVDDAIRRLPAAGFKAKVAMTRGQQRFDDLELILGKAKFTGALENRQPEGERASMLVKLDGGELDVDGLRAFASLFVTDAGVNRFADRDLDIGIKAGPVKVAGLTADKVDTALRLRDGVLEIDRLSIGGLAGASVSATGRIKDFPAAPMGNIDASVVAVDLAPLIALAAEHAPDNAVLVGLARRAAAYPGLFADARADLVASVARNDDGTTGVALSGQGEAGGTIISATLSGQGDMARPAEAPLHIELNARNDDATSLLALAGVRALPLGAVGAGEMAFSANGGLASGMAVTASLKGDDFNASFEGTASDGGKGQAVRGRLSLDAADVEPWLMTTGVALPGMGAGRSVALAADAKYADGQLTLAGLSGTVNEAAFSGDIAAQLIDSLPHLTGSLVLDEIDFDPLATLLLGEAALVSADGDWPGVPFQQKPVAPFSAELAIKAGSLAAGSFATAYDAEFSLRIDAEGIRVSDLKGKFSGGELTGLFELKNNGGTALFSGQAKLSGADMGTVLEGAGLGGVGDFSTSLSAGGKSVGGMIATLSGSGTAVVDGLTVPGLNPDAFSAFIGRADALGRDIDGARVGEFAPDIASAGSFAADKAEVAFTVAGGVLRAPPLTLANPQATLSADLRADLNTGTVAANGAITYKAGDEALVGSEPSLRFALEGAPSATTRLFDTEPLAQFLTQRALEKEQARVEAMQASLLEKQRLRREARHFAAVQAERERAAEIARQRAEEARQKAEELARAKAAEQARVAAEKAQAEAKAKADAAALAAAEAKAAEDARRAIEEKARIAAEEKSRLETIPTERPANEVERAPLPEANAVPAMPEPPAADPAVKKRFDPFTIDGFLKSLETTN